MTSGAGRKPSARSGGKSDATRSAMPCPSAAIWSRSDGLVAGVICRDDTTPAVEVRSKRVGGANYQVPMQLNKRRQQSLSFRWIIEAARDEKGRPMHLRLAKEFWDAAKNEGKAVTTKENTHRMADANKAFAHFAW